MNWNLFLKFMEYISVFDHLECKETSFISSFHIFHPNTEFLSTINCSIPFLVQMDENGYFFTLIVFQMFMSLKINRWIYFYEDGKMCTWNNENQRGNSFTLITIAYFNGHLNNRKINYLFYYLCIFGCWIVVVGCFVRMITKMNSQQ